MSIGGERAGTRRRNCPRRIGSFKLFLCLEAIRLQDGNHEANYGDLWFYYLFIFTGDAVSLRP